MRVLYEKIGKKLVRNCVYHYYSRPTWINPPSVDEYPGCDDEHWNCRFFKSRKSALISITNDAIKYQGDEYLELVNDTAHRVCVEAENNGLKIDKDQLAKLILKCMIRED